MLTIERNVLMNGLSFVGRAIDKKNNLPVLSNVYIDADEDTLILRGTNLEISSEIKLPCTVKEPFSATVSLVKLYSILSARPKSAVEFKIAYKSEKEAIRVSSGRWWSLIKGIDSDLFPVARNAEALVSDASYVTDISLNKFLSELDDVAFCVASGDARPQLNGIYLHAVNDAIYAVSTDGFSLARVKTSLPYDESFSSYTVPVSVLSLIRIASKIFDTEARLIVHNKSIVIFNELFSISVQLMSTKYPDYTPIIDTSTPIATMEISASELVVAVSSCLVFSVDTNVVRMVVDGDDISVYGTSTESGSSEEVVTCLARHGEETFRIAFDGGYMRTILKRDESIYIHYKGEHSPIQIVPVDNDDTLWILMPMYF